MYSLPSFPLRAVVGRDRAESTPLSLHPSDSSAVSSERELPPSAPSFSSCGGSFFFFCVFACVATGLGLATSLRLRLVGVPSGGRGRARDLREGLLRRCGVRTGRTEEANGFVASAATAAAAPLPFFMVVADLERAMVLVRVMLSSSLDGCTSMGCTNELEAVSAPRVGFFEAGFWDHSFFTSGGFTWRLAARITRRILRMADAAAGGIPGTTPHTDHERRVTDIGPHRRTEEEEKQQNKTTTAVSAMTATVENKHRGRCQAEQTRGAWATSEHTDSK